MVAQTNQRLVQSQQHPYGSHERIYQYVYDDKKNGGHLYRHRPTQHKRSTKHSSPKGRRNSIPNRVPIPKRLEIVNQKQPVGYWEVDLIIGAKGFALIVEAGNKKADTIQNKLINTTAPYKELVNTIISDNGTEFTNHQYIAQKLQADYYFADPYSSWQPRLNEYTNKLYRQYLPKKSNFNEYDTQYFVNLQNKLNNRPRKLLGFKTPLQVFIANFKPN